MRKSYKVRGRNPLVIEDEYQSERFKTISFSVRGELLSAPLSKSRVRELIKDLEKWLEED